MSQHDEKLPQASPQKPSGTQTRRAALGKLGLGVAVVYSAPVMLKINRPAAAEPTISVCPPQPSPFPPPPWCPPEGGGGGGGGDGEPGP